MKTDTPVRVPLHKPPLGLLESVRTGRRNVLELIPDIATKVPILSGRTVKRWHMIMDPGALKRILKDNVDNYPKSVVTKLMLNPAIGDSLFIAEGAHWRWQRRAAAPVFSHRNVTALGTVMSAAADRASERLAALPGEGDLYQEMVTATFEVISDVTFSGSAAFDRDATHKAIETYMSGVAKVSFLDIIGAPPWVPRPGRMFTRGVMGRMKDMADQTIDARRAAPKKPTPDLLDLLLDGEDPETKRQMTTAELRDNLLAFIVAGHETTALALGWALYLCAFDPKVQDKLRAEATKILQGRTATAADVPNLPYTRQVIDETLRLYPPAAFLSRTAAGPDTLCGREVRKGDTVILPIYALHRNELLWDNPDHFDPDRFADAKNIDRFANLPFGDGPRICIGASFAIQETVIVLATLISRFRFSQVAGRAPKPVMILTLRPEGGVWLKVEAIGPGAQVLAA
ncbi:MAG: cytochrome P450 [Deltaproteobacteria bacterium]